jgi:hypothetical protein
MDTVLSRVVANARRWKALCNDALLPIMDRNLMLLDKGTSENRLEIASVSFFLKLFP